MRRIVLGLAVLWLASTPIYAQIGTASGSLTAADSSCLTTNCRDLQLPGGTSSVTVQTSGTFTATLQFEGTAEPLATGTYVALAASPIAGGAIVNSTTSAGIWEVKATGLNRVRVRVSAYTSGTAVVRMNASGGTSTPGIGTMTCTSATCTVRITDSAGNSILTTDIATIRTDQTTHGLTDLVAGDITKVAGTAIDTNSGNKSAGTQRFVLATDQPQLTNPLLTSSQGIIDTTEPAAGGDAAQKQLFVDSLGRAVTSPYSVPALWFSSPVTTQTTTTGAQLMAADATYKYCITWIAYDNTDAANSALIQILEGGDIGTGTALLPIPAVANHGGGFFALPTPKCTSAVNKSLNVDATAGTTSMSIALGGFKMIN